MHEHVSWATVHGRPGPRFMICCHGWCRGLGKGREPRSEPDCGEIEEVLDDIHGVLPALVTILTPETKDHELPDADDVGHACEERREATADHGGDELGCGLRQELCVVDIEGNGTRHQDCQNKSRVGEHLGEACHSVGYEDLDKGHILLGRGPKDSSQGANVWEDISSPEAYNWQNHQDEGNRDVECKNGTFDRSVEETTPNEEGP
mmetsp:Transcript_3053/g.8777  ORF Transcript_3053/g.8777 Transcript_3053/m.8777 type:complete len:206 (+) Transcript_3053:532-1149(+)